MKPIHMGGFFVCFMQLVKSLGVQYVTQQASSLICSSARVVVSTTMQPVWRLEPHLSRGQDGSVQSVKCARLAGESNSLASFLFSQMCVLFYFVFILTDYFI